MKKFEDYETDLVFIGFNPRGNLVSIKLMTEEEAAEVAEAWPSVNTFFID